MCIAELAKGSRIVAATVAEWDPIRHAAGERATGSIELNLERGDWHEPYEGAIGPTH